MDIVNFQIRCELLVCLGRESEQRDSNPRPTAPKAVALAKLRYAPIVDSNGTFSLLLKTRNIYCRWVTLCRLFIT